MNAQAGIPFLEPEPEPPAMVTIPLAELAKLKRLLKRARDDRKSQGRVIEGMREDNDRLYRKLNTCGWGLDCRGQWTRTAATGGEL
ncbi:MAG: hypothetical protein OXU88_00335 [Gammaproteobacteria bacterium]|nr:hypothetical protein [Gammaproteobacteria bacterium]